MNKKHLHVIGLYWHSSSELHLYRRGSEQDGIGGTYCYFQFCPECGKRLTKRILAAQEKM